METKVCTKCGENKKIDMFGKQKKVKSGLKSICKECEKEIGRKYRLENKDKILESNILYRLENKEKILTSQNKYKEENLDKVKEAKKKWKDKNPEHGDNYYSENKEKILEQQKQKYLKLHPKEKIEEGYKKCSVCGEIKLINKHFKKLSKSKDGFKYECNECKKQEYKDNNQRYKDTGKQYYKNNKEIVSIANKEYRSTHKIEKRECYEKYYKNNKKFVVDNVKKYHYARLKYDINYKLLCNYRSRLYSALKHTKKSKTTRELIGCSLDELRNHLENKFTEGMSWDNYGKWHVDHIKPCAKFDFSNENEQKECFNYSNLQPLWAIDNLRKQATYIESTL